MTKFSILRRLALPLLLLLLVSVLTACGGTALAAAATTPTATGASAATVVPAATVAPVATVAPEATEAPAASSATSADGPVTFLAILPSATRTARVVSLTRSPAGAGGLTPDLLDGKAAKVEKGVWEEDSDGAITLTLEEADGKAYDKPVVLLIKQEGDNVTINSGAAQRSTTAAMILERQDDTGLFVAQAKRAFVTIDAAAGAPLDPFFVSVNGGGELNASQLAEQCTGYVYPSPVVSLNWRGKADFARIFVFSDQDTTLVIQTPDGEYLCGDDAQSLVLDPSIDLENPSEGRYNIWVGGYQPDQLVPAILVLTSSKDVDPTNFDLGSLVKRPPMMQTLAMPERHLDISKLTGPLLRSRSAAAVAQLKTARELLTQRVTGEGEVPAFDINTPNVLCNGFIGEQPDYTFEWSGSAEALNVLFEGDRDATLVVVDPDGVVICNDDAIAGKNLNPLVVVANPGEGQYKVFVGRIDVEQPVKGAITVTGSTKPEQDLLAPVTPTPAAAN